MPTIIRNALTAARVAAAKPGPELYRLHDGAGLYLTIEPSGARRWEQRIDVAGKRTWRGLGSYPERGLADARDESFAMRRANKIEMAKERERKGLFEYCQRHNLNRGDLFKIIPMLPKVRIPRKKAKAAAAE